MERPCRRVSAGDGLRFLRAAGRERQRQLGQGRPAHPVRKIVIDRKPGDPPLRAGMSAVISIDTGHRRWWRLLNG